MTVRDISEAAFQRRITDLCDWLGLYVFHSTDARRDTAAGFPDLTILNLESGDLIFAELKREKGRVSPKQSEVLFALERSGNPTYVWRPSQWDEIEATVKALARTGGAA